MLPAIRKKQKLVGRVRRMRGQMEALERLLEAEVPSADILNLVASVRGALNGLTAELVEDHLREHVLSAPDDRSRQQGADDLVEVVRTYLR